MSKPPRIPAFVLGNGVNALGVVRSLGRRGVPVHLVNDVVNDLAARSRFAKVVRTVRADDPAGTVRLLVEEARRLGTKPVLIYTTDRNLQLVSSARAELELHFRIQVPSADAVRIVVDKAQFAKFTDNNDFPAPRTFAPVSLKEAEEAAASVRYPVALKPALSFDWDGRGFKMRKAKNPASLIASWKSLHTVTSGVLIQEFIEAPDDQHHAYYAYRAPGRGELAHILVRKLRVFPIRAGVGSILEITRDPQMEALGRSILERLDYIGAASVCFKLASETAQPFIYEINGRFPQCHTAFALCGYDVPYLMYRDMIGEPLPAPGHRESTKKWVSLSLDISAFRQYRERGDLSVIDWVCSYGGVRSCAEFAWDDPLPLASLLGRIGRRVVVGPGRRLRRKVART